MPERAVRCTEEFFDRLDLLLPEDRDADGIPSVTDSLAFELPAIRDRLAPDYERSTMPTVDPDVRVFVGAGLFVRTLALCAAIDATGTVAVFWITLDLSDSVGSRIRLRIRRSTSAAPTGFEPVPPP